MKPLNQSQIAFIMGYKRSHFHRLLSGERNLKWPAAKKFAARIGSKPEIWLYKGGTSEQRKAAIDRYLKGRVTE